MFRCRLLLALGNVDNSIWLLLRDPKGSFSRVCRLKGHADWIRSLAFKHTAGAPFWYPCKVAWPDLDLECIRARKGTDGCSPGAHKVMTAWY